MHNLIQAFRSGEAVEKLFYYFKKGQSPVYVSPLVGSAKSFFTILLNKESDFILVLFDNLLSVQEFAVELQLISSDIKCIVIDSFGSSAQEKLTELSRYPKAIIISTFELLIEPLPSKETLENSTTNLVTGSEITYGELLEYLAALNYSKNKFVESPGDYAVRGSIIDFWSYSESMPARIEFDGDFIESIKIFDPDNQRSIEKVEKVSLAEKIETLQTDTQFASILNYINKPAVIFSKDDFFTFSFEKNNTTEVKEKIKFDDNLFDEVFPDVIESEDKKKNHFNGHNELFEKLLSNDAQFIIEESLGDKSERIELQLVHSPIINSRYEILINTINEYLESENKIIISAENELQAKRLNDILSEMDLNIQQSIDEGKVKIINYPIKEGFYNKNEKLLLLTDYQIFGKPYRTKISKKVIQKKNRNKDFASLRQGDFVVHEDYGIGKYLGLEEITIGESKQESMKLLYAEGGLVYVNLNYLHLVKKYSSKENITPRLSTLGTVDWVNLKRKTKKKIKEFARDLIELYAKRKSTEGFGFSSDTVWQRELEASFIYEDTHDQAKVTEEVKQDMQSSTPMDRLVCGDVGFGKTEIAVRAAFKAVQDGKQVAVLVPTTILAEQHFNTFSDRLSQFPVKIAALSRFQTKREQNEIIEQLKQGQVDIIIGTHRLLSKDIELKDLGLLIIDEEHRFGVMHKEKLRSLKLNVDTLTLTATPIPRTLNFSLLGARDLSLITTPPPNRQPIYTSVTLFDISKIKEWIYKELTRGGQVYFVHDRVQSIDKLLDYLKRYLPDVKFAVAHGQMKSSQLEDVIHGFLYKKYDVLICTKIIESGIDIPNVNTIIINRADRFGLAELHQLRGRVGRSDRQAYAYLLVPSMEALNKNTVQRLRAIEEFSELGVGFNISMRDLEIRGAGNLLGTEQSGFINDVGFDLYIKMINEAVEELKTEEFKNIFDSKIKFEEKTDTSIDTYFEIGIPKNYMPEQSDRLSFYTSLYTLKSIEDLQDIKEEIRDRYGELPDIVNRLIECAELKYHASLAQFDRIVIQKKNITFTLPKGAKEEYYNIKFPALLNLINNEYQKSIKFVQQKEIMKLVMENISETPEEEIKICLSFIKRIRKLFEEEISLEITVN